MRAALAAALLALAAGCSRPSAPANEMKTAASYDVIKGGRKVAWIKNAPGPIVSRAAPPPGGVPATHPFLTATSYDAVEEDRLRSLLEKSRTFDEYVALLKKNGYSVAPAQGL